MKRFFSQKVLLVFLSFLMLGLSLIITLDAAPTLDGCHKYCAEKYPSSFQLYLACMDGCINAPQEP